MRKIKKNKWKILLLAIFGTIILWGNYQHISHKTKNLIFDNSKDIPKSEYALFLGTPKYLPNGNINNYYKNRIKSAIELYTENKIEKIIISADTLNKYKENEIELIKFDLIKNGVSESDLILDNNGNRTWNSIIYLEGNMSMDKIILISQKFHLERAIFIAKKKDINVVGFEAKGRMSNKLRIREVLARIKMQIDLITD